MKNKDLKKGKESIIGKIIYGFLLFMPLLAILSTILVNTFNKEVTQPTQEAEITYKYETNEVNTYDDIELNKIYQIDNFDKDAFDYNLQEEIYLSMTLLSFDYIQWSIDGPYVDDLNYNDDDYYELTLSIALSNGNAFLNYTTFCISAFYVDMGDFFDTFKISDAIFMFTSQESLDYFITYYAVPNQSVITKSDWNVIESVEITTQDTSVNDIFYYAVDKVENSNLFNWATNSLIYTGIANTCTQLSITTTFIPLLLAYWLIISIIYILYDIILMILIILHNKVHRLQDTI